MINGSNFKTIIVIIAALIIIGFLPSYAAESKSNLNAGADNVIQENDIVKFLKTFSSAYKKGDADEYMSFYSNTILENGGNTYNKIKTDYLNMLAQNIITVFELKYLTSRTLEILQL